jgi:hypothetical protein
VISKIMGDEMATDSVIDFIHTGLTDEEKKVAYANTPADSPRH